MTPAQGASKLTDRQTDQAAGLRSILGVQPSRKFAFISAITGPQKFAVMSNLAAAFVHTGSEVMLLDASHNKDSIRRRLPSEKSVSLWDLTASDGGADEFVHEVSPGIRWCQLSQAPLNELTLHTKGIQQLSDSFKALSEKSNVWLVDIDHEQDPPFVLPELSSAELIVLTSCQTASIKKAYAMIKSLYTQLGRRAVHLVVYGASAEQASVVQRNMAKAASEFLTMSVLPLGNLPVDEDLARAMQMKRSVIEAFPRGLSSSAFKQIAAKLLQSNTVNRAQNPRSPQAGTAPQAVKGLANV
jgi:flagellar biosynthesis protein FlhG